MKQLFFSLAFIVIAALSAPHPVLACTAGNIANCGESGDVNGSGGRKICPHGKTCAEAKDSVDGEAVAATAASTPSATAASATVSRHSQETDTCPGCGQQPR